MKQRKKPKINSLNYSANIFMDFGTKEVLHEL